METCDGVDNEFNNEILPCSLLSDRSTETTANKNSNDSLFVTTARCLMSEEKLLSSGCKDLDVMLKGGFSNRGITQIYGAAGTGKTQLALQLCLTVQLPVSDGGYEAGAVYICTEGTFPSRRLQQLLGQSTLAKKFDVTGDLIFVETLTEISDLENCITQKIPCLLAYHKIGLLVLDSIAAPYRAEYAHNEMQSRAKSLWTIAQKLHVLANQYKLTVICINQVSAVLSSNNLEVIPVIEQPTLGITWANMITNSFYLCRKGTQRYLHIMQSSYLPRSYIEYKIISSGVSAVIKD